LSETDFLTALSQLLRDGAVRDEFADQPEAVAARLARSPTDRATLARLSPGDLEAQAQVLLRKRFRAIEPLMPETCAALGAAAWPLFAQFARTTWPADSTADALAFCESLLCEQRAAIAPVELHRLRFLAAGHMRFSMHLVRIRSARIPQLQILFRRRGYLRECRLEFAW
jgi:hypothetical protein